MIGVDIIKIPRVRNIMEKFGDKFLYRWFHKEEILEGKGNNWDNPQKQSEYFSKRFAAKEAYLKALGHGLKIKFSHICVKKDPYGKPLLFYQRQNNSLERLENTELSLSDDGDYAIAFVIIKT